MQVRWSPDAVEDLSRIIEYIRQENAPAAQRIEFARELDNMPWMPWHCREFVVKDCDGRLLAFGANL
jgi:hypothetical protein